MGFAHRSILRLPLSRLDGYGSWGRGPPMLVRIETSGVCVCVCVCVFFFFFFCYGIDFWLDTDCGGGGRG